MSASLTFSAPVAAAGAGHPQQHSQRPANVQSAPLQRRRALLASVAAIAAAAAAPRPSHAAFPGIESVDLPSVDVPAEVAALKARNQAVLDEAEATFQNSDLLKSLKEKSEANRGARKKALEDLYCRRQAEYGAGDCSGLRLIPGMTKSGVQERPEWLENLFGK